MATKDNVKFKDEKKARAFAGKKNDTARTYRWLVRKSKEGWVVLRVPKGISDYYATRKRIEG